MADSERVVLFRCVPPGLRRRALEEFACKLRDHVTSGRNFRCLLTNDGELQRLNHQFLGKNYPTDVLSFPACSGDGELGELAISGDRAAAQAQEFGHSTEQEIRILMLHGVLHLMGLDHERDRGAMARKEKAWRRKFGLPNGLIERASA